jgi:hypothetical protein
MQISISYLVEGSTDVNFLEQIIKKVFENAVLYCTKQVEILTPNNVDKKVGEDFVNQVLIAAQQSVTDFSANIFCVQADADNKNAKDTINNKINPALSALAQTNPNTHCHNLVAIIPIQETEAWILADTTLLKKEIGTTLTDIELDIYRSPETIADPKQTIIAAIRRANQNLTKKRRHNSTISDLYEPIGAQIDLNKLRILPSFQAFETEARAALEKLGLRFMPL